MPHLVQTIKSSQTCEVNYMHNSYSQVIIDHAAGTSDKREEDLSHIQGTEDFPFTKTSSFTTIIDRHQPHHLVLDYNNSNFSIPSKNQDALFSSMERAVVKISSQQWRVTNHWANESPAWYLVLTSRLLMKQRSKVIWGCNL